MKKEKDIRYIKELFNDFEVSPPTQNWTKVENTLEQERIEATICKRMEHLEVKPSEKVWNNIESRLPIHIVIRRHLYIIAKVAAVIGFCFFAGNQITPYLSKPSIELSAFPILEEKNTVGLSDPIIAANRPTVSSSTVHIQKRLRKQPVKQKKAEVSVLLEDLFAEEEDYSDSLDLKKIKEILQPLELLPISSATAFLGESDKFSNTTDTPIEEVELNISVPLTVVEEHEVEELIKIYDEQKN